MNFCCDSSGEEHSVLQTADYALDAPDFSKIFSLITLQAWKGNSCTMHENCECYNTTTEGIQPRSTHAC